MNDNLIDPAETATIPAKANRRSVKLNKSAVDAEALASGEEASLDPQPPIEPSRYPTNTNGPTKEGLLNVVLVAPDGCCNLAGMPPKDFPNLVYVELCEWQHIQEYPDSFRLKRRASFVVPVEPWRQILGEDEAAPLNIPCCQFLAVSVRGAVPMPAYLPSQIIHGSFKGVLKTIEAMWPTARRLLASDSIEAPAGWLKYVWTSPRR